jgi:hypothetical protein
VGALKGHGRYILDEHGEPVLCEDIVEWGRFFENIDNRRVAQDKDEGPDGLEIRVSTVFIGVDHQFGTGPPLLWETLVFGGLLDGEMRRYSSRAAALDGHQKMCRRVSESIQKRPT